MDKNLRLEELIDIPLFQDLQERLNEIYSFPSAIIDNEGKILTAVAWQDICTHFHRKHPECEKECIKSDQYIFDHLHEADPAVSYQCPHGLIDNAAPIIIDGQHLGNFFTGQFFLEKPDLDFFRKQAQKYGFDEEAYLEAVEKVPVWTKEKVAKYLDFIKGFIQVIAGLGLKNIREKEINDNLLKSEERFRLLVENSADMVTIHDADGKYLFYSGPKKYGIELSDVLGKTPYDFFEKDVADNIVKQIQKTAQTGEHKKIEIYTRWQGKMTWFEESICPLKKEERIHSVVKICKDITERKQQEIDIVKAKERAEKGENQLIIKNREIALQNERLESLLRISKYKQDSIQDFLDYALDEAIKLTDSKIGYIYHYNEAKQKFILNTWSKTVMKECSVLNPQTTYDLEKTGCWGDAVRLRRPIIINDYNLKNPNIKGTPEGHVKLSKFLSVPIILDDKIVAVIGVANKVKDYNQSDVLQLTLLMDSVWKISERIQLMNDLKKAKETFEEGEQRLKLASRSAELGIWDWNVPENIMVWDERMFQLYGISKETFINTVDAWMNGLHPEDKERAVLECNEALEGKKPFNTSFRVLHPDGKVLYLKADGLVLRDSNGKPKRMIGVNRDITESKLNEIELLKAKEKAEEANRLKTEFLNNMSHEIRTPMNGIIGFSEMLDKPGISEEKRKYYSKIIQNSSHQLLKIIDDILEISTLETRQEKLKEEPVILNDLLMELFSIFNLKSKERNIPIYLKKEVHDHQSHIVTDKTKLTKILSNLLENAIKFTHEGFIELGYKIKSGKLILYVKDTGVGISPQSKEVIFERFSQEEKDLSRTYGGLGLGLSISKENAQLLGGDITVESEKGKGSVFYVTIPYKPANKEENQISGDSAKDALAKADEHFTILVAEDEEVNYLFIEEIFEGKNNGRFTLLHAKNGTEAVDMCMNGENIDLVLMDIKMPVMNGLEATEKIKLIYPNLPVIAQTAYSTESDKALVLSHGCDDFISKPLSEEKLFELIKKYLKIK